MIYPWLLSVFPILHLYSENLGAVPDEEVLPAVLVSLAITTGVFLHGRLVPLLVPAHREARRLPFALIRRALGLLKSGLDSFRSSRPYER